MAHLIIHFISLLISRISSRDGYPGWSEVLWTVLGLLGSSLAAVDAQSVSFPRPEILASRQGLPQGFVPAIVQDSQGFIWMATRDGLCRYDGHKFKVYQPEKGKRESLSSLGLESMQVGADQKIWITSDKGDIDVFDPVRELFSNFSKQPFYQQAFGNAYLKDIFPDRQNRLWLIFDKPGIACINLGNLRVKWYRDESGKLASVGNSNVRDIVEDKAGTLWVATRKGIFRLLKGSETFLKYSMPGTVFEKIDAEIYALRQRTNGDMLLLSKNEASVIQSTTGEIRIFPLPTNKNKEFKHPIVSDGKGNDYFFWMQALYRFSTREGLQKLPEQGGIAEYKSLYVDRSDVLWAGTNGQGVQKFNLRADYFKTLFYKTGFITDLLVNFLGMPESQLSLLAPDLFSYNFRYTFDSQAHMWFSAGRTPLYKFDLKSKQLTVIPFPVVIQDIRRSELPVALSTDPDGRIWAVYDTLAVYHDKGRWQTFRHKLRPEIESGVLQIVADKQALWIATTSKGLYSINLSTGRIRHYHHEEQKINSLGSDDLYCLLSDPLDQDLLWIGTFGGGMCRFNKRTGLFTRLTKKGGLPNDVVYAAIPDRRGYVWAATNQGLCQVNKRTFSTRIFTREDGLMADEFNRFHFLQLPDGRIFLGGVEGITAFDPAQASGDGYQPLTHITSILINNRPLMRGEVTKGRPVTAVANLDLAHGQNFVTVEFAAMQFNRSDQIRYRYQLVGLEGAWTETEEPVTKYTDLRPGKYLLRLNASNTVGVWSRHVRTLSLTIAPPWWETWWAYLVYCLVACATGYALVRSYINRLKLRQAVVFKQKEVELKERESLQLREIDEMKTNFFSNMTHEFRTPLTLILAPTDQMLREERNASDANRLTLIDRNARQLLGLVNQLLDLSKLESGSMKVVEVQGDLFDFVARLVQTFDITARAKGVHLRFLGDASAPLYWFDHEKLERILNNLISNAVKFTNENGEVVIAMEVADQGVKISVSDTGIGIPKEKLGHILDRFYQVDSVKGYQEGTGIGLAIVKELTELQGGTLAVSVDDVNFSTVFTVCLPYRTFSAEQQARGGVQTLEDGLNAPAQKERNDGGARILLVEDNPELADFIAGSFGGRYHFDRAGNGEEGLSMALDFMPDLVISDVMMPVMDGFVFCHKLKSNLQTSHIPVILLTARSSVESKMEGLTQGADDYLTKPFHLPELALRIRNLLERQRRFQALLHAQFAKPGEVPDVAEDDLTDPFMSRLYTVLEGRLEDPAFGVTELTREIGMSNSSLNRKLKATVNISAVELIRNYRLKKAAGYLADHVAISEAAYLVGFDNLSYFSKCFRDFYGVTPREFAHDSGFLGNTLN